MHPSYGGLFVRVPVMNKGLEKTVIEDKNWVRSFLYCPVVLGL